MEHAKSMHNGLTKRLSRTEQVEVSFPNIAKSAEVHRISESKTGDRWQSKHSFTRSRGH